MKKHLFIIALLLLFISPSKSGVINPLQNDRIITSLYIISGSRFDLTTIHNSLQLLSINSIGFTGNSNNNDAGSVNNQQQTKTWGILPLFLLFILFFILFFIAVFRFRVNQIKEKELVNLLDLKTKEFKATLDEAIIEKERIEALKIKEEEANRLKSAILSKISHELRTPMNNILGFAYLLSMKATEHEGKKMAEDILNSGNRLMEALDSLLELAYFERSYEQVNLGEVDFTHIINESSKKFRTLAKNKNIDFLTEITENLYIHANEASITKALDNLIENAVKFTNSGSIKLKSYAVEIGGNHYASLDIIDTGVGMEEEKLKTIFDPFKEGSYVSKPYFEGTGLNLIYSKRIVEISKGSIAVTSKPGEGSIFTVKIPVSTRLPMDDISKIKKSDAQIAEENKIPADIQLELLLVEDNIMNKELINFYLRGLYKLDYAPDGYWAIRMCAKKQYAGILMDINLKSDMDGLQASREIRQIKGFEKTPIAAVTGYTSQTDLAKIHSSECTQYLAKPFDKNALIHLLNEMFLSNK
jgi:signal transduction histidine kinase